MRVLVTNDDGIDAPGLAVLVAHLVRAGHDVVAAAPVRDASGSGTALGDLTDGRRVAVSRVSLPGHPAVPAYAVHAPPAFAALCGAVGLLDLIPDVVVAGVNPGWNTGLTVQHSSTVGAALTAASTGLPAIALSCGPLPHSRFDTAAAVGCALLARDLRPGVVLNVNVPDVDLDALRGAVAVPPDRRGLHGIRLTRDGDGIVIAERDRRSSAEDGTDSAAVLAGWVAVTELLPGFRAGTGADCAAALNTFLASAVPID